MTSTNTNSPPRNTLLRQWTGPLTRELVQTPGGFGLGKIPASAKPDAVTTMTCGFCSTGCGLNVHLKNGEAVGLTPDTHYPVNLGMACPKGWEALAVLKSDDRATTPLLRQNGKLAPVDWDTALRTFVERFRGIREKHGPDSLAWIGTGQIVTEELALLGAVAKFGMGIQHGDGNTRQCMATAVVAYKEAYGFDSPPFTYADFEESDLIVLVGSNLCIAHPILWERVCRNRRQPQIVVIDPRRTETAMASTLHLPIRPKSDLAFFYGIAHLLIANGWIDRPFIDAHTSGFDAFAGHVREYTPAVVAERSGIDEATLQRFAAMIHECKGRVSFWWTMGVNQSYEGVRVAQAIINLSLMTGNIGKPGTGANSITGQCNAMGSRLFSNTTNLLGGRDFMNAEHRADVASILGFDPAVIPDRNSLAYDQIVDGIASGKIKGLWVIATNPSHSWIGQSDFRRMLSKLEFLVVQDMYHSTETAQAADLLLPAAAWGEKEGTFINSERRIGLAKKVARAPGQALDDFSIVRLIAEYWGCGEMFREWDSPEAVFRILQRLSAGRPCDITGIEGYQMLDREGGVQWPLSSAECCVLSAESKSGAECRVLSAEPDADAPVDQAAPSASHSALSTQHSALPQERRLFSNGQFFHADGKARFIFENPRKMPEPPSDEYPFILLTGRGSAAQWHTQTRTSKSAVLRKLYPADLYVEINPQDAERLGIEPDAWVTVESQRGRVAARVFITPTIQPGQLFLPMHDGATNRLTDPVFDPYSRQPSYKSCAARIRKTAHWES